MSKEYATNADVKEIVGEAVNDLSDIISTLAQSMHYKIGELRARHDEFDKKLDKLTDTIDGFLKRIDHYETEMAARDSLFQKLLEWAKKVSVKTGIPLDNL